ncbi:tail fiber assembly protein [Kosakonia cowanii]
MSIYAVVENGVVINTVVWDGKSEWKPETGEPVLVDGQCGTGWFYDGTTFSAPPVPPKTREEIIDEAEGKKQSLLADADKITADWRTELALGMLEEDDKETLTKWMRYIRVVKAVDVSTAPDIKWPEEPAK